MPAPFPSPLVSRIFWSMWRQNPAAPGLTSLGEIRKKCEVTYMQDLPSNLKSSLHRWYFSIFLSFQLLKQTDCWDTFSEPPDRRRGSDTIATVSCESAAAVCLLIFPSRSFMETTLSSAHFIISAVSRHRLQPWTSELVHEPASFSNFVMMIENSSVSTCWAANPSPKA